MKAILVAAALLASGSAIAQERDARGIPVQNAEPNVPAGANAPVQAPAGATFAPAPNQQAVFAPRQATGEYPPCQRGQTDRCTQTYERGRAPR